MKTTIWKSDLDIFKGLKTFVICNELDITEFTNFYIYSGNVNPYELKWISI